MSGASRGHLARSDAAPRDAAPLDAAPRDAAPRGPTRPAGLTRREALQLGVLLNLFGATGGVPALLARAVGAVHPGGAAGERVLVIVQLTGGNDGLNMVVPWADDLYHRARPVLAVPSSAVTRLDDETGLAPPLAALGPCFDEGRLAVLRGVGPPVPDRSHFRSMEIWHSARVDGPPPVDGWLGRAERALPEGLHGGLPFARLGGRDLPFALVGTRAPPPAPESVEDLQLDPLGSGPKAARRRRLELACTGPAGREGEAAFVAAACAAAFDCGARLEELGTRRPAGFPSGELGRSLALCAQLIGARLGTRVLYVTQGGYDTHARQKDRHPALLRELADSLAAFDGALAAQGDADRVVTFVFSEFGRRIHENASGGTDHGAGNPVLLLGAPVHGGVHGQAPALDGELDRDVPVSTDFRCAYASLLAWLGLPPEAALPGSFEPLPLLSGA